MTDFNTSDAEFDAIPSAIAERAILRTERSTRISSAWSSAARSPGAGGGEAGLMELMPDNQMCLTFAGDEAGDASFSLFNAEAKNPPN